MLCNNKYYQKKFNFKMMVLYTIQWARASNKLLLKNYERSVFTLPETIVLKHDLNNNNHHNNHIVRISTIIIYV